jgi:hypothetical protein
MRAPLKVVFAVFLFALAACLYVFVARVTIRNDGDTTLTHISLSGDGVLRQVSQLPPGSSHTFWFAPSADTSVHLRFRAQSRDISHRDLGYFAGAPGPQVAGVIAVRPDLQANFRYSTIPRL